MDIFGPYALFLLLTTLFSAANAKPAAVSVPASTNWYGYDGAWSAVSIRVGSPPQWVDVFVSTASVETWVIGLGGCGNSSSGLSICRSKRGGLFDPSASSTWKRLGFYELGLEPELGFGGAGLYGYDNVDFEDKVITPGQILGVVNTTEWWLGMLGLGIRPTNFTTENKPSLLSSLAEVTKVIPSHSYGFTAGASYRLKSVPASLTLGGYDKRRFVPHDTTFTLDTNERPVTSVNGISVTSSPTSGSGPGWAGNSYQFMSAADSVLMNIDSSTPYLWLPESVCQQFEKALNLTYDDQLQLYTYKNGADSVNTLSDWNLTFTFALANLPTSQNLVDITLPFDAFNLQLQYPFPGLDANASSAPVSYFPLRKAANNTQYVLGRTFLQEAYLKVDYERGNFSVYQAVFNPDAVSFMELVNIPSNNTLANSGSSSPLGVGAIAGIAVGGAALLLGGLLVFWHCRRVSPQKGDSDNEEKPVRVSWLQKLRRQKPPPTPEMPADIVQPVEAGGNEQRTELDSTSPIPRFELAGDQGSYYAAHAHDGKDGAGINASAYQEANAKLHHRSELHGESIDTPTSPGEGYPMPAPMKNRTGSGPFEHYAPIPGTSTPPTSPALSRDRHFSRGYPGPPPQYLPPPQGPGPHGILMGPPSPGVVSSVGSSDGALGRNNSRDSRFREGEMGGFGSDTLSPGATRYGSHSISPGTTTYGSDSISPGTTSAEGTLRSPGARRYSWESEGATR